MSVKLVVHAHYKFVTYPNKQKVYKFELNKSLSFGNDSKPTTNNGKFEKQQKHVKPGPQGNNPVHVEIAVVEFVFIRVKFTRINLVVHARYSLSE